MSSKSRPYIADLHERLKDREYADAYLKECSDDFETYKLAVADVLASRDIEIAKLNEQRESWRTACYAREEKLEAAQTRISEPSDKCENAHPDTKRLDRLAQECSPYPESMGKPIEYFVTLEWTENQSIRDAIDALPPIKS